MYRASRQNRSVVTVVAVPILFAIVVGAIAKSARPRRIGGATIGEARLVTEAELERIAKPLPLFLAAGADDSFNYYQLRELGYFKTDRRTAAYNQPNNKTFLMGLLPVGSALLFVSIVDGRIVGADASQATEANVAPFTKYMEAPQSGAY